MKKDQGGLIMELRTAASPKDVKNYDTKRLREEFLIEKVFMNFVRIIFFKDVKWV